MKPVRWTALEVEIKVMKFFGVRQNIIVPNVSWGFSGLHECDLLILSSNNYAAEVEIKISKSDLLADFKKRHRHYNNLIARFFYAVPVELKEQALEVIPPRAGLIVVERDQPALMVRNCKRNMRARKWSDKQRLKLLHLGNMRILGLKKKIFACKKQQRTELRRGRIITRQEIEHDSIEARAIVAKVLRGIPVTDKELL